MNYFFWESNLHRLEEDEAKLFCAGEQED